MTDIDLRDNSAEVPIIRGSERGSAQMCWQHWQWGWREGLVKRKGVRTALWFGTGIHLALAKWYLPGLKRGAHPVETWEEYAEEELHSMKGGTDDYLAEQYIDAKTMGTVMLNGYVEKYGTDEHMDFIQAEKSFELLIPWPELERRKAFSNITDKYLAKFVGTYDGVYRNLITGRLELLETKTAAQITTSYLTMDNQAGGYWAIANIEMRKSGLLAPKESIGGINYNFLRKALPDERPKNADGYACNKPTKEHYADAMANKLVFTFEGDVNGTVLTKAQLMKLKVAELAALAENSDIVVLGEVSKIQPPPLFERELIKKTRSQQKIQLRRIQDEAVHMQAMREKLLPITKNPTRDCHWRCAFFEMCELQDSGGEWKEFKRGIYKKEDPYTDHRKSAGE